MKAKGLCIATRCRTIDEFVARFHPFCDGDSLFVATLAARAVGTESAFMILLRSKAPALRGWCVVLESWTDANNRFGRPGLRLGFKGLSTGSKTVFARMLEIRDGAPVTSRPRAPTVAAS